MNVQLPLMVLAISHSKYGLATFVERCPGNYKPSFVRGENIIISQGAVVSIIKKLFYVMLICVCVIVGAGEWIYGRCIRYNVVGERAGYTLTDPKLMRRLDSIAAHRQELTAHDIARIALEQTSTALRYSDAQKYNDPNRLINSGKAHCVGYAALCTAIGNYLLASSGLSKTWQARHSIGWLYLFEYNLHQLFDHPFFKDHDFVTFDRSQSGEVIAVDPTVHDYLRIERVRLDE